MKILVVDDVADIRMALEKVLTRNGHEVKSADNGLQALNLLGIDDFDMLITDIIMPKVDGIELIKEVKAKYPDIKVIAMSGGGLAANYEQVFKAAQKYVTHFLEKPFSKTQLINIIERME